MGLVCGQAGLRRDTLEMRALGSVRVGLGLGCVGRDEAQVDASVGRKDGMGLAGGAMFAPGASGHGLASWEAWG